MSHGGAQWCHRANTMDNLRTAVVKQLNRQKRHLQESYCGRPICVKNHGWGTDSEGNDSCENTAAIWAREELWVGGKLADKCLFVASSFFVICILLEGIWFVVLMKLSLCDYWCSVLNHSIILPKSKQLSFWQLEELMKGQQGHAFIHLEHL